MITSSANYKNTPEINRPLNVLVTGAGSVYGVGIIRALKASSLPVEVTAIDINPYSLGLYIGEQGFLAPPVKDEESYYLFIKGLCKKHRVKAIFIGSEKELSFYAKRKDLLERSTGVKVFVSSPQVIKICRDKWLTMCWLTRLGFNIPLTIRYPEDSNRLSSFIDKIGFPLIIKPRMGHGSQGVILVKSQRQLLKYVNGKKKLIIQEYLPGEKEEFTVGVCLDSKGKVISKIALKRELQDGVSIAAVSEEYQEIADHCGGVAASLGAYGAINIQLRLKEGKPVIFEINPRFSSSTGMRLLFGINEPESLIISEVLGEEVTPRRPKEGLVLRQYNDYYFPLAIPLS